MAVDASSLIALFVAGFVSSLLPCTYPLILGYVGILVGGSERSLRRGLAKLWLFFAGFAATFVTYGAIAGIFGTFSDAAIFSNSVRPFLVTVGGVLLILIGLVLLHAVPLPNVLRRNWMVRVPSLMSKATSPWTVLLLGVVFAAGWTPCIGPVLGGALVLAGTSGSVAGGALLLFVFSVGLFASLFLITVLYVRFVAQLRVVERALPYVSGVAGVLFILLGISFLTGHLSTFSALVPEDLILRFL